MLNDDELAERIDEPVYCTLEDISRMARELLAAREVVRVFRRTWSEGNVLPENCQCSQCVAIRAYDEATR